MKLKYEYIGGPRDGETTFVYATNGPMSSTWEMSKNGLTMAMTHMRHRADTIRDGDSPDDVEMGNMTFHEYVFDGRTGDTVRYRATGVVKTRDEINGGAA